MTDLKINLYGQKQEKFVLQHRFGSDLVPVPAEIGPTGVPAAPPPK